MLPLFFLTFWGFFLILLRLEADHSGYLCICESYNAPKGQEMSADNVNGPKPGLQIRMSEAPHHLPGRPPYVVLEIGRATGHLLLDEVVRLSQGIQDEVGSALCAIDHVDGGGIVATLQFYESVRYRLTSAEANYLCSCARDAITADTTPHSP